MVKWYLHIHGVSGPIILSSSAHLLRVKNIENLLKENKIILQIDLKPSLEEDILDKRLLRDFNELLSQLLNYQIYHHKNV